MFNSRDYCSYRYIIMVRQNCKINILLIFLLLNAIYKIKILFQYFPVVFCCFQKLYNVFLKTIECHICSERVRVNDWRKSTTSRGGGHRKECAQNNQEFLRSLPEPFDVRCPTCFSYLKLLPKVSYAICIYIS